MTMKTTPMGVAGLCLVAITGTCMAQAVVLQRMAECRERRQPYFIFCNLYDVHAPYSPTQRSILRPGASPGAVWENLTLPYYLAAGLMLCGLLLVQAAGARGRDWEAKP